MDQKTLLKRLHILQGQLNGVEKLIAAEEACPKVLTQIKAVRSGLMTFTKTFLESRYCDLKGSKCKSSPTLQELLDLLVRY